jgi:hypothetical protein
MRFSVAAVMCAAQILGYVDETKASQHNTIYYCKIILFLPQLVRRLTRLGRVVEHLT